MEQYGFGAIQSPPDIRDYVLSSSNLNMSDIPLTYLNSPVKIKNQGNAQTCVAHALASLVEFHNMKESKTYTRFSTDFIYGYRLESDYFGEGMYLRDGLKTIQKYGDVEYSLLPGNTNTPQACTKVNNNLDVLKKQAFPNRISTYYKINTLDELKYSLYHYGPVVASMKWYDKSTITSDGVYCYNPNNQFYGHAVLILGWDENNIIVQNSWGINFGKKGLFYVPFNKMNEVFKELYGITDDIINIKQPSQLVKISSPLINLILKLIKTLFK